MNRKSIRIVMLAALLAALASQPVLADYNLVQNGSFETATVNPGASQLLLNPGDTSLTSWVIAGTPVYYVGGTWQASQGQRSIYLDPGDIFTNFAVTRGWTYQVSFDLAGNPGWPVVRNLGVDVDNTSAGLVFHRDYTFDTNGTTETNMGWTTHQFNFTAYDSITLRLHFSSANGAAIDNVVVKPVSTFLSNGSFTVGPPTSTTLNSGDLSIYPWTVGGSGIAFQRVDFGNADINLNSSAGPGAISQDIPTIPGEVYQVSFDMAGILNVSPPVLSLRVLAAGQSQDFSSSRIIPERKKWKFSATATTTTLTFQSLNSGSSGPYLDNVEVVRPGTPVLNGSFEQNHLTFTGPFVRLSYGSAGIDYWTVGGPDLDCVTGGYWQASQGGLSIDLNGAAAGSIEQTFLTTPGAPYQVHFDLAGNPLEAPAVKTLRVAAAGRSRDFTFDTTGKSVTDMGWTTKAFTFTAKWPTTTLSFQSLTGGTSAGATLDNVRVTKASSPQGPYLLLLLD